MKKGKLEKRRVGGKRDLSGDEYSDGEDGGLGSAPRMMKKAKVEGDLDGVDPEPEQRKMTPFEK